MDHRRYDWIRLGAWPFWAVCVSQEVSPQCSVGGCAEFESWQVDWVSKVCYTLIHLKGFDK